jgi:putative ABC transport system substrate-binding protein
MSLCAGAAALALPRGARAQQPAMPVVGFLRDTSFADATHLVNAFHRGLKEAGFVEGQNVAIEYGWGEGDRHRLATAATDFIRRPVNVIVGNLISTLAAKAQTATVPIVFATGSDPVQDGLVTSLNRPGGNVTGVVFFAAVLGAKRLDPCPRRPPLASW